MAFPFYIEIKHPRQEIKGTVTAIGKEGLILGLALETLIMDAQAWAELSAKERRELDYYMGFTTMKLTVETGPFIPHLYRALCSGEELSEVQLYFPTVDTKTHKEHVYFQQRLYPVKLSHIHLTFPDVKASEYYHYPHMVQIWLRYRFLESVFVDGYHLSKVEWPCFYSEGLSEKGAQAMERILRGDALTDHMDLNSQSREEVSRSTGLWSPAWRHKDEKLQQNSPSEAAEGDTVILSCESEGLPDGAEVCFELEYREPGKGPLQFASINGAIKGGEAAADWTVDLSKLKKKGIEEYTLSFVVSYRSKPTGRVDIPLRVGEYTCDYLELPDVLFNLESAVPCIDFEGKLLSTLTAVLKYTTENPDREVVIFGHTDVTGSIAYNHELSADRALATKTLLSGDADSFVSVVRNRSKPQDYQQILKVLTSSHGWPCDPGVVDGKPGPKTRSALESFQKEYNRRFNKNITVDGTMGPQTWKALFPVIREILTSSVQKQMGAEALTEIQWAYNGKGIYPCGESFPKEGIPGSDPKNRRVEIVFFEKGKAPTLLDHVDKNTKVTTSENPVYDSKRTERKEIVPTAIEAGEDRWVVLEETAERIDPDLPYELSKAQSPKNRWFYVFGSTDGSQFSRVWEIRTDTIGKKYATIEITQDNYDARPEQEPWEEVAFLPGQKPDGSAIRLLACVSDVRLSKERIFDKRSGLLFDPLKRCVAIDDPKQTIKKLLPGGEEKIVVLNPLLHAELLRKKFDEAYPTWVQSRTASWLEADDNKKREKLLYEFGALVVRIIEAYPEYRKHLAPGHYPKLYEQVKAYDEQKVRLTRDVTNRVDALCRFVGGGIFSETCRDYICLIRKGSEQSKEYYAFEDRVGAIVEDLTRFPQGSEVIKGLIRTVKSQAEHSWLQDMLLLKNDTWSATSGQGIDDSRSEMSGEKRFQNYRKLGDGAVKLFLEGAKAGVGVYKPHELASILEKVFATTGESVKAGLSQFPMRSEGIKPFQKVLGSFDKNSFWRIELKGDYENMFTKGPLKVSIDRFLLGLEGIALLYSVKDHIEKSEQGKAGDVDHANITVKLITYFVKSEMIKVPYKGEWIKLGKGPIAVGNGLTSLFDTVLSLINARTEFRSHDYDSAFWSSIATAGNLASTIGYGTLATTFFAGAAASSSTGIGIAPGLLLAFAGSVIAIGGKVLAAQADNTPLENMLLRTPWGTHPELPESAVSSAALQDQYIGAMRLITSFKVSIDHDSITAVLHLRRLEPTTVITIHEVTFGIPTRADGSSSVSQVVGTGIRLSDGNCQVSKNTAMGTVDVRIDLRKICSGAAAFLLQWKSYYNSLGKEPKPDYVKLVITVDLDGDGIMMLPDSMKRLHVEKHYAQKAKTAVA